MVIFPHASPQVSHGHFALEYYLSTSWSCISLQMSLQHEKYEVREKSSNSSSCYGLQFIQIVCASMLHLDCEKMERERKYFEPKWWNDKIVNFIDVLFIWQSILFPFLRFPSIETEHKSLSCMNIIIPVLVINERHCILVNGSVSGLEILLSWTDVQPFWPNIGIAC